MSAGHTLRFEIPAAPEAVALARHRLLAELEGWGTPVDRDVAQLLLSETVTNAILHGTDLRATDATIRIDLAETEIALRVEVHDTQYDGIERPARGRDPGEPTYLRVSGRGLNLVAALAKCWGVEREDLGKYVYFELGNALDQGAEKTDRAGANGGAVSGGAVNGDVVNGGAVNGRPVNGSALNGSALNGNALNGSALNGSAVNGSASDHAEH